MNRRDTIIIAVLLNAGVLAILFMLAVNEKEEQVYDRHLPAIVHREPAKAEAKIVAAAKPAAEEFFDFTLDDSFTAVDDQGVPMEEYAFIEESKAPEPQKAAKGVSTNAQTASESYVEVVVKKGDSLDKLARMNGTTIESLKRANNLKSDMLAVGQTLRVPAGKKAAALSKAESRPALEEANGAVYYTIKSGDSPWKIARQNNMNLDDLLRLNGLDEDKARNLKIGDKIRIQ